MPQIRIAALFHPSTTPEGKVYIAALAPQAHFAYYGPNRANAGGTKAAKPTLNEMEKTVRSKQSDGYTLVDPSRISAAMKTAFTQELLRCLGMPQGTPVRWAPDGTSVDVAGVGGPQAPTGAGRVKPVVWNSKEIDVWI